MNAVEVRDLEKRFGPVRALAGVSTAIRAGTCTRIAGPNGAGKSTLLRVLAALTRPTRGEVCVLGRDPFRSEGAAARGRIGYLGPEPALYAELTLEENLEFCARLHGVGPTRVHEVIRDFGLERVAARRVRTLSQGFRRRAGLARALLAEPELLLLDEPWNGLDAEAAQLLDERLRRSTQRGATLLIAAHDGDAGGRRFDRTLLLRHGRLADGDGGP